MTRTQAKALRIAAVLLIAGSVLLLAIADPLASYRWLGARIGKGLAFPATVAGFGLAMVTIAAVWIASTIHGDPPPPEDLDFD